ncbi:unnamed protein product, partial [Nesidiocoris tenuis]
FQFEFEYQFQFEFEYQFQFDYQYQFELVYQHQFEYHCHFEFEFEFQIENQYQFEPSFEIPYCNYLTSVCYARVEDLPGKIRVRGRYVPIRVRSQSGGRVSAPTAFLGAEQGAASAQMTSQMKWDEDNNNVKKEPPLWALPPHIPGMSLFGYVPPLTPFFLPRGLPLPPHPPPPPTPPQLPAPPPVPVPPVSLPNVPTVAVDPAEILRRLGPEQESPMDLRLNKGSPRRTSPAIVAARSPPPVSVRHSRHSPAAVISAHAQTDKKVPLDLSCVKHEPSVTISSTVWPICCSLFELGAIKVKKLTNRRSPARAMYSLFDLYLKLSIHSIFPKGILTIVAQLDGKDSQVPDYLKLPFSNFIQIIHKNSVESSENTLSQAPSKWLPSPAPSSYKGLTIRHHRSAGNVQQYVVRMM